MKENCDVVATSVIVALVATMLSSLIPLKTYKGRHGKLDDESHGEMDQKPKNEIRKRTKTKEQEVEKLKF
ncbi:transmembrane protein, putative [Medicago truncatula]|uniref:Transmembrane protein, putative n=1 Tax=Medicago truncatula TaxID=3880 RepID=G7KYI6_MEDTR|nr:transmembrane protein, putative [Medicago truncatula]